MIFLGLLIGYILGVFSGFFSAEYKKRHVEVTEEIHSESLGRKITNNVN